MCVVSWVMLGVLKVGADAVASLVFTWEKCRKGTEDVKHRYNIEEDELLAS